MKKRPYAIEREIAARIAKLGDGETVTFDIGPLEIEVSKGPYIYGVYIIDKRARDVSLLTLGVSRSNTDAPRMIAYAATALHVLNETKEALANA